MRLRGGRRLIPGSAGSRERARARAAGKVELARRGSVRAYAVREVPPQQAGAVLKEYVRRAPLTQPYFRARPDSPAQDFATEAALHPVFELVTPGQD